MEHKININDNTRKLLFAPTKKREVPYHNGDYLFDIELSNINELEKYFRSLNGEKPKHKPRIININKNRIYHYVNGDMDVVYEVLSDHIKNHKNIKELKSYKRYGKCHDRSLDLVAVMKNSSLLTGYISFEDIDILHTVVECEKDGKTKIVDYTKNLIMDKEEYIGLTNFRIIQKISREDFLRDNKIINRCMPRLSLVVYLCFRDEIMKDLKKNSKVLKLEQV